MKKKEFNQEVMNHNLQEQLEIDSQKERLDYLERQEDRANKMNYL